MVGVQLRIVSDHLNSHLVTVAFVLLYLVTLGCMIYLMLSDPGQLKHEVSQVPDRAHKSWKYEYPILRYDHYCRWATNCVGLRNHRSFLVMTIGLYVVAVAGSIVDIILAILEAKRSAWFELMMIVLHLVFSFLQAFFVGHILEIHVWLICHNALTKDWEVDRFWNTEGDEDVYDRQLNRYDHGWWRNCLAFWTTRRGPDQLGEF